jgi:hypothetical protein
MMMTCLALGALLTTNACGVENQEPLSEGAAEVNTATNTWDFINAENCNDITGGFTCNSSRPPNQCPEAANGEPCFYATGHECYKVINTVRVDLYRCT